MRKRHISLYLPIDVWEDIRAVARKRGLNASVMVQLILTDYLDGLGQPPYEIRKEDVEQAVKEMQVIEEIKSICEEFKDV
jgi:hypothetical protein